MTYSNSWAYPSCPLVKGRNTPWTGHQSITGHSILWNGIVSEVFSNRAWQGLAWNRDKDPPEPVPMTPCSDCKYHFCFKWRTFHAALDLTHRSFPSDVRRGPLRITRWEMFDFVLLILSTVGMWSVSSLSSSVHIQCGHLSSPLSYLLHLLSVHRLWVENQEWCWCLRCWLDIRPRGLVLLCGKGACLAQTSVIELISV